MAESATNATISISSITDASGAVWGIVPTASNGGQVTKNGVTDTSTYNVAMLVYAGHTVYHQNTSGNWYSSTGSGWSFVSGGDPRKTPSTPTASPTVTPTAPTPTPTTTSESADGTTVSSIGPALVDATGEKWTLASSSSMGNQIAVNGTVDSTTQQVTLLLYKNHRVYQENINGGWWWKAKSSDSWTYASDPRVTTTPTVSTGGSAPSQAAAVGYKTAVLSVDFNSSSDVSTQAGQRGGFYTHCPNYGTCPSNYYSISNGVLTMTNNLGAGNGLTTVNAGDNPALSSPSNHATDTGGGLAFQYGYFEASIAFDFNISAGYWPSFWCWPIEQIGGSPYHNGNDAAEFDFLEVDNSKNVYCSFHEWSGAGQFWPQQSGTPSQSYLNKSSANAFNTYGFLWTPNSITWYFNNQPGTTVSTANTIPVGYSGGDSGPGSRVMVGANYCHNFLILGTGSGWPMQVDWVRVWQ